MEAEARGGAGQALGADDVRPGGTLGGRTQPQGVAIEAEAPGAQEGIPGWLLLEAENSAGQDEVPGGLPLEAEAPRAQDRIPGGLLLEAEASAGQNEVPGGLVTEVFFGGGGAGWQEPHGLARTVGDHTGPRRGVVGFWGLLTA